MGFIGLLIKLFVFFGIVFFICYPIGVLLSRGPLGFWAWIIVSYIVIKAGKIIYNL